MNFLLCLEIFQKNYWFDDIKNVVLSVDKLLPAVRSPCPLMLSADNVGRENDDGVSEWAVFYVPTIATNTV